MAVTQLRASGAHVGPRYGSFAGRGASGGAHPVDTITQARSHGAHTGSRYGSFDGRGAAGGAHPVGRITQPRSFGAHAGRRYGAFDGRGGPPQRDTLTWLRTHGAHTGRRYGSFGGKPAADVTPPQPPVQPTVGGVRMRVPRRFIDAQRAGLVEADEILLLIAGAVAAGLLH